MGAEGKERVGEDRGERESGWTEGKEREWVDRRERESGSRRQPH
jgi:hypothetical protein